MMNIEKQSLEVHVDLCAQRYTDMTDKIDRLEKDISKRMDTLEGMLKEIKKVFDQKEASALKTMFAAGLSAITALLGISGGLLWYIITHPN